MSSDKFVAEHKPDLCTVIVEDAHQADRHRLIDAATQSFPGEGEHERHPLLTTGVDDGVKSLIQASCERGHVSMNVSITVLRTLCFYLLHICALKNKKIKAGPVLRKDKV